MTNGDYLLVCEDKVIAQLNKDADDVYLVQVVASLEYPPPEIKTLAHEKMV